MAESRRAARLELRLEDSSERECPEFNYKELLAVEEGRRRAEKEKRKIDAPNGLWDPLSDDEDVAKIAKQFEQKYGGSSTYGRSKGRCKRDDYADIGAGYDENDSFIDNTDGYDEIIPPECDTACGGFYINSGSLEFKQVAGGAPGAGEAAAGDSSPPAHKKSHKRRLSSSESEDSSSSDEDDSDASAAAPAEPAEPKDAKATDSDRSGPVATKADGAERPKGDPRRKKRKSSREGSASSGQESVRRERPAVEEPKAGGVPASPPGRLPSPDGSSDSRSSDSSKRPAVPSSDNRASSDSSRSGATVPREAPPAEPRRPDEPSVGGDAAPPAKAAPPAPPAPPRPPPDLSREMAATIRRLETLADAHFSSRAGKLSGPEVNEIVLGLELQCRRERVSSRFRHALFAHAAHLLRRGKAGLVQMARKLVEENQRAAGLNSPVEKLKCIIERMKPHLLESYKTEAQKIMDINKRISVQNAGLDDDRKVSERRLPKRRFPWNDQVREVLREVLRSRGMDVDSGGDAPVRFLQTVVLPLFPPGFVRMPTLLQQVRNNKTPKNINDANKKAHNKSGDSKEGPVSLPVIKPPVKGFNDRVTSDTAERNVSDLESAARSKPRTPTGPASVGIDSEERPVPTKNSDAASYLKNDRVLSVAIERMLTNSESDKNDPFKVQCDPGAVQTLSNNVSISISSVFPKKSDSEKIAPPKADKYIVSADSVIVQPISDALKDSDGYVQRAAKSSVDPIDVPNGASTVIKAVDSYTIDAVSGANLGNAKTKSANPLFDKNTLAKIISGKNTDPPNKQSPVGMDALKIQFKGTEKAFNKPIAQDCSHLIKRKPPPPPAPAGSIPQKQFKFSAIEEPKPIDAPSVDNFIKPSVKSDFSLSNNRYSNSLSQITSCVRSKFSEPNTNGNNRKDSAQSPSVSQNERNHGSAKSSAMKLSDHSRLHLLESHNDISSGHKISKAKKLDNMESYDSSMADKRLGSEAVANMKSSEMNKPTHKLNAAPVLNVDDSSSDDCVEILTDEENSPNKSFRSLVIGDDLIKKQLIKRQVMAQREKLYGIKDKYFNNSVDHGKINYTERCKDKWLSNPVKSNLSDIECVSKNTATKKTVSFLKTSEPEIKKNKQDPGVQIVDEVDPLRGTGDRVCDSLSNSLRKDVVSVIRDAITIKSDRITDIVPEKSSGLILRTEKDTSEREMVEDDIKRVMQDLKELQNLQMRSESSRQSLYDDPSNS